MQQGLAHDGPHEVAAGHQLDLVERDLTIDVGRQLVLRRLGHPAPHAVERHKAEETYLVGYTGTGIVRIGHAVLHQPHGRSLQVIEALLQRLGIGRHLFVAAIRFAELSDSFKKRLHRAATLIENHHDHQAAANVGVNEDLIGL